MYFWLKKHRVRDTGLTIEKLDRLYNTLHKDKDIQIHFHSIIHSSCDIEVRRWGVKSINYYIDRIDLDITFMTEDDILHTEGAMSFFRGQEDVPNQCKLSVDKISSKDIRCLVPDEITYDFRSNEIWVKLGH